MKVNPATGAYFVIREIGFGDADAIEVAGRTQIPSAPSSTSDHYAIDAGSTLNVDAAHGVLANDRDGLHRAISSATLVRGAQKGSLTLRADGSIAYTPAPFTTGTDDFTYEALDSRGNRTGVTTVTIDIRSVAPVARPDSYTVPAGTTKYDTRVAGKRGVLANDTNPRPVTDLYLLTKPKHGALTLRKDGSFVYVPTKGYKGSDVFTYQSYNGVDFSFPTDVALTVAG